MKRAQLDDKKRSMSYDYIPSGALQLFHIVEGRDCDHFQPRQSIALLLLPYRLTSLELYNSVNQR